MPGFGYDPFGEGPFGEWDWSKAVLYDLIPEIYKELDADNDEILKKLQYGLRYSFDNLRFNIRKFSNLRDPLQVRTQYDEVEVLTLGPEIPVQGELSQRGIDGKVLPLQEFTAPTARFRFDDIGKELLVSGSTIAANNRRVRIARIVSPTTAFTDPQLLADPTPFRWELRPVAVAEPGVRTVQLAAGTVDRITPGWFLDDGTAQFKVVARRHFNWQDPSRALYVLQEGFDATFDGLGNLIVQTGSFSASNIGQKIVVARGTEPLNNGDWEIAAVLTTVAPWTLQLVESVDRVPNADPCYWGLLPRAELDIEAVALPRGVAEQQGITGVFAANFSASNSSFDADDVGKLLTILGSTLTNNGTYTVTGFVAPNNLTVTPAFVAEVGLTWSLRRQTTIGATKTQVQVYAPSLIQWLAKDFGIEIDFRESESIQRSWVQHISRWINIKGLPKSYEVIGLLTGLLISATKLYRVTQETFLAIQAIDPDSVIESGESGVGRFGFTGALTQVGFNVRFTDSTAGFLPHDVGRHIRVRTASDPANLKLYTIDVVISSTQVQFRHLLDIAITPDFGPGGTVLLPTIEWAVVRLYSILAPLRPRFDEFNSDMMTEIIGFTQPGPGDFFGIDRWCWEADMSMVVPFLFVSVTAAGEYLWQIVVQTPGGQPASAEVIEVVGNWVMYDKVGTKFFVDTVPVNAGIGLWTFQVFAAVAPVQVGASSPHFDYECPVILDCDFCASNKILLSIELGPALEGLTGLPTENILARALERVEQVKPAHVEVIQRFIRTIEADLFLTASVEPHPFLYAILYARLAPYYDDFPADWFTPDFFLLATLEVIVIP